VRGRLLLPREVRAQGLLPAGYALRGTYGGAAGEFDVQRSAFTISITDDLAVQVFPELSVETWMATFLMAMGSVSALGYGWVTSRLGKNVCCCVSNRKPRLNG
jgi:hypothetical protein